MGDAPDLLSLQSYLGDWATPLEYSTTAGAYKYDYILAPQWRPIETAPKDGADILTFGSVYSKESAHRVSISWWSHGRFWTSLPQDGQEDSYPTHWMPLPNPPPHDG